MSRPDETNPSDLPSQYELCRIAAALPGRDATTDPVKAVRAALSLWFSAGYEIARAKHRNLDDNIWEYGEEGNENSLGRVQVRDALIDAQTSPIQHELVFGTSPETSEAMRWLIENAKDKRDKLKNFRGFERAWREVFDDVPCFSGAGGEEAKAVCCVKLMEIFLRMRENARLEKDAARQRKKRAKISAPSTRQTKSMPDS